MFDRRFLDVNIVIQGTIVGTNGNSGIFVNDNENHVSYENLTVGDQYLVIQGFDNKQNHIAKYAGLNNGVPVWEFTPPKIGSLELFRADTKELIKYNGSSWGTVANFTLDENNRSIVVRSVETFIYGVYGNNFRMPENFTDLRGRIVYHNDNAFIYYSEYDHRDMNGFYGLPGYSNDGSEGNAFASLSDGKIYVLEKTYNEKDGYTYNTLCPHDLYNGEIIFNKEDGCFYQYNTENHNFSKIGGRNHFIIDDIVDTARYNYYDQPDRNDINASYNTPGSKYLSVYDFCDDGITCFLYFYPYIAREYSEEQSLYSYKVDSNLSILCMNNYLTPKASIITTDSGNVKYELNDQDIIYNKFDGCTYIYHYISNTLEKISTPTGLIPPVLDFITDITYLHDSPDPAQYNHDLDDEIPAPTHTGEKRICFDVTDYRSSYKLYTAIDNNTWNEGILPTLQNVGDRYVSLADKKIYQYYHNDMANLYSSSHNYNQEYPEIGMYLLPYDIPVGGSFLNKADNTIYVYDGTNFIPSSSGDSSSGGDEIISETHTLTASEVTNKSITLANSVKTGKESQVLLFIAGLVQIAGIDFTASGNTISWNAKGLENRPVAEGDTLVIQYTKA